MAALFFIRLVALAAGTLVYLFLIALILGHRRPRLLERLLFFLVLSIFLIYAGGLLEINAQIQYGAPPSSTSLLYKSLLAIGIAFILPLTVSTHMEYLRQIRMKAIPTWAVSLAYCLFLLPIAMAAISANTAHTHLTWGMSGFLNSIIRQSWLILVSGVVASLFQFLVAFTAQSKTERALFWSIFVSSAIIIFTWNAFVPPELSVLSGVLPGAVLIYFALKHNFLEYGAQRNLVYALAATFLAVLYLALVRRVSGWLEPVLPREATAAILLFVLIFLFEPLERAIGPTLHRAFSERMAHVQRVSVEIQQEARQGDVARLLRFAERRVREEFGLAAVRMSVPADSGLKPLEAPGGLGHVVRIPLQKEGKDVGFLEAASTGTYLTGETSAALEFLGEQLPGTLDLCRLIEEKLRLERELAERERMALLGQMAASVSHNLRNPLSSMKTILQVQLENPELPLDVRHDCALVVGEIDRMGEKLKQLLNFAKPSVNGQSVEAVALVKQTAALFARDAERRNVRLEFDGPADEVRVMASEEALNEVLSNLIVNAMEAQTASAGGRVRVGVSHGDSELEIRVEDDGPGITLEERARIFEPYYTTKASGTGLGLAIVARRVAEMGGTIMCESPVRNGRGARFVVRILMKDA
ncbi:MAG TPA: ATP-binding protein [Candidatus Acidoferrales bacterium]|nr:ATP-binding protein [Candidatus Acidoferrales bacterium]